MHPAAPRRRGDRSAHAPLSAVSQPLIPSLAGTATQRVSVLLSGSWPSCSTRQASTEPFLSSVACTSSRLLRRNKPRGVRTARELFSAFSSLPFSSQLTATSRG